MDDPLVKFARKSDSAPVDYRINVSVTLRLSYIPSKARSHELAAHACQRAWLLISDGATAGDVFDRVSGHVGTFTLVEWNHGTANAEQPVGLVATRGPASNDDGSGPDRGSGPPAQCVPDTGKAP